MKTVMKNMVLMFFVLTGSACLVNAAEDYNYPLTPDANTLTLWHMNSIVTTGGRYTENDPLNANKQLNLVGGTIVGGATANLGNAIHFDSASSEYGKTDSNAVWQDYYEVYKLEGWCKFDDFTQPEVQVVVGVPGVCRISGGEGSWFGMVMWYSATGKKQIWFTPAEMDGLNNTWFHFVGKYDGAQMSLRVEGPGKNMLKTLDTSVPLRDVGPQPIYVGCNLGVNYFMTSAIDDIRVSSANIICPGGVLSGDINEDCYVNLLDLEILVSQWMEDTDPQND